MQIYSEKCYTVAEITLLIQSMLEQEFPKINIKGEISNFRASSTGHYYFSLKDKEAIISVVMFKNRISSLKFQIQDGILVIAKGNISVYAKRGTYQLICEELVKAGEGDILAMLEERKKKLASEGLFDRERKKALPLFPSKVAVITSPTGAAIKDILRVLHRRHSGVNLVILPTPVQGDEAAATIALQIRRANKYKMGDVIIIGRGGGSLEDLLAFSEEEVVYAVARSKIPIISAVGHEIDITLADLAADVRAPTPSAAAELVSASRDDLLRRVRDLAYSIETHIAQKIEKMRLTLSTFSVENMERNYRVYLQPILFRLDDAKEEILKVVKERILNYSHKLAIITKELEAQSPLAILKRGFAIVINEKTKRVIIDSQEAALGDDLNIKFFKGKVKANVKESYNNDQF